MAIVREVIEHPDGAEKSPPISPTMQCVINREVALAGHRKTVESLFVGEETIRKASDVLTKFYDWLERTRGSHSYEGRDGEDSGCSPIERI